MMAKDKNKPADNAVDNRNDTPKVKMAPNPYPVEEVYVDGISGVMGRGGIFKLECYRIAGTDQEDGAEVRRVTHRLVFPSIGMNELVQAVQSVVKNIENNKQKKKD